jgi:hypothetical protein
MKFSKKYIAACKLIDIKLPEGKTDKQMYNAMRRARNQARRLLRSADPMTWSLKQYDAIVTVINEYEV